MHLKKIIAVCLACVLAALAAAALGDGAKFVTVQEWLDFDWHARFPQAEIAYELQVKEAEL